MNGLGARRSILVLSHYSCEIHCYHLDGYKAKKGWLV